MLRTVKNEPKTPETKKITKSDWLTPTQFAKKYGITGKNEVDIVKDVTQNLYKKGLTLNNITHSLMVIKNRKSHQSGMTAVHINPAAHEIILEKIKNEMKKKGI